MKLKFTRKEYKYRVPGYLLKGAISLFSDHLNPDEYNVGNKPYVVRSLYYDSSMFKYYFEKVNGEELRKKIRLRTYGNDFSDRSKRNIFLEIKNKNSDKVFKERYHIENDVYDEYSKTHSFHYLTKHYKGDLLDVCINDQKLYGIRPVVLVLYRRIAYIDESIGFKINVDYDIHSSRTDNLFKKEELLKPTYTNMFVMEMKYKDLVPEFAVEFIRENNLFRSPYSKYCESIDKVYGINN